MEMTYGGALVMPSSYAMMDEEEMMYLEGGKPTSFTVSYSEAKFVLGVVKGVCRAGALLGYATAAVIAVETFGLGSFLGVVVAGVAASTMWSWADVYGNALIDLEGLDSSRKVRVTENMSGLTLRVTVKNV